MSTGARPDISLDGCEDMSCDGSGVGVVGGSGDGDGDGDGDGAGDGLDGLAARSPMLRSRGVTLVLPTVPFEEGALSLEPHADAASTATTRRWRMTRSQAKSTPSFDRRVAVAAERFGVDYLLTARRFFRL
jgi:hypothetical protein